MATARKKQDEKHLKILRELVSLPANKQCFDCHQRGPTYVNMTIGSFVCTSCSGMLRGLTPPHRVKSISMASFSSEEVELIRARGNEYCRQIWLGLYDPSHPHDSKDEQQVKDFMVAKYERKRYYVDPTTIPRISAASNAAVVAAAAAAAAASASNAATTSGSSTAFSSPEAQVRSRSRTSTPQSVGSGSNDGRPASGPPAPLAHHRPTQPSALTLGMQQAITLSHDNMFTPDKSSEFLADFGSADPFSSSQPQGVPVSSQPSFANFDNNPAFSSSSMPTASTLSSLGNGFGSPARKATSSMGVNQPLGAIQQPPSEDRYAALKDLDSLMKSQQQQPPAIVPVPEQSVAVPAAADWASAAASPWPVSSASTVAPVFPQSQSAAFGIPNAVSAGFPDSQSAVSNPFGGIGSTQSVAVDPWAPTVGANGMAPATAPFGANPFRPATSRRPSQPGFGPLPEAGFGWGAEAVPNGAILAGTVFPTSQSMNFPAKAWHSSVGNPFVLGASPAPTGRSSNPFL